MNEKQNEKQAIHFGIKIRNKKYSLRLCREEFALINTKPSFKPVQWLYDIGAYTDYTCSEYSREWCEEYREICLKNYDINMEFFKSLDKKKFDNKLKAFLRRFHHFKQIYDLNEADGIPGFYIMVLDEYKQVYIGKAQNMKKRIQQHWTHTKQFDITLYPMYEWETSCFSIDFFRALDTTRIYIWKHKPTSKIEEKLIRKFPNQFMTNRIGGGINNALEAYKKRNKHLKTIKKLFRR